MVTNSVTFEEPNEERGPFAIFCLTQNPGSESPRGFVLSGLGQGVSAVSGSWLIFSGSRESHWSPVGNVGVTTGAQRNGPKLSESLFNDPLGFNTPDSTAVRT